jgi:hypothetical protein
VGADFGSTCDPLLKRNSEFNAEFFSDLLSFTHHICGQITCSFVRTNSCKVSMTLPSFIGAHTSYPLYGMEPVSFTRDKVEQSRNFIVVVNENNTTAYAEARQMAYFADVTDEKIRWASRIMSLMNEPGSSAIIAGALEPLLAMKASLRPFMARSCSSLGSTQVLAFWTSWIPMRPKTSATSYLRAIKTRTFVVMTKNSAEVASTFFGSTLLKSTSEGLFTPSTAQFRNFLSCA